MPVSVKFLCFLCLPHLTCEVKTYESKLAEYGIPPEEGSEFWPNQKGLVMIRWWCLHSKEGICFNCRRTLVLKHQELGFVPAVGWGNKLLGLYRLPKWPFSSCLTVWYLFFYVRLLNISTPKHKQVTTNNSYKVKVVAPTFTQKIGDDNTRTPQVQEEAFPGCFTWHDRFHQKFAKNVAGFSLVSICLAIVWICQMSLCERSEHLTSHSTKSNILYSAAFSKFVERCHLITI